VSSVADDAAALISGTFDLFNDAHVRGEVGRADLERIWDPEAHHETRFTALEGRAYEGYDGLEQFLGEAREQFERFQVELERLVGQGDRRVAIYTADALTRDTQIPIKQRLGMTIELRDGRLYRTKVYADPREALEAFGFAE
jgi:ketosteroid isomerase-like protein